MVSYWKWKVLFSPFSLCVCSFFPPLFLLHIFQPPLAQSYLFSHSTTSNYRTFQQTSSPVHKPVPSHLKQQKAVISLLFIFCCFGERMTPQKTPLHILFTTSLDTITSAPPGCSFNCVYIQHTIYMYICAHIYSKYQIQLLQHKDQIHKRLSSVTRNSTLEVLAFTSYNFSSFFFQAEI